MMLRTFDALVNLTANVPVAGVLVIVVLGLATDFFETLTHRTAGRRSREALMS